MNLFSIWVLGMIIGVLLGFILGFFVYEKKEPSYKYDTPEEIIKRMEKNAHRINTTAKQERKEK
jgi:uncharacterized protein YneF (UPF0154 family)